MFQQVFGQLGYIIQFGAGLYIFLLYTDNIKLRTKSPEKQANFVKSKQKYGTLLIILSVLMMIGAVIQFLLRNS